MTSIPPSLNELRRTGKISDNPPLNPLPRGEQKGWVSDIGYRVSGIGHRASGIGHRASGIGHLVSKERGYNAENNRKN